MEAYAFCQSCGMPIGQAEFLGTEKDLSKSTIYCRHCYSDGEFTDPDVTIEDMKKHVRAELLKAHAPEAVIAEAVAKIKYLSRWMGIPAIHHSCEWH